MRRGLRFTALHCGVLTDRGTPLATAGQIEGILADDCPLAPADISASVAPAGYGRFVRGAFAPGGDPTMSRCTCLRKTHAQAPLPAPPCERLRKAPSMSRNARIIAKSAFHGQ